MPTFPAKINYAAGNVLTAAQMVDIGNGLNDLLPDAKGSLTTVSAANTPAQLTVGSDGSTLVADSSTSTGLRWQGNFAAGKNYFINGAFDYWQRSTSYALTSTLGAYGAADRWGNSQDSTAGSTASQITSGLPAGFRYGLKVQRNNGSTTTGVIRTYQVLETSASIPLAGQTITVSFWAKAGANYSPTSSVLNVVLATGTGTDQSAAGMAAGSWTGYAQSGGSFALTTSWQRFTWTISLGSSVTQTGITFYSQPTGTAGADDSYQLTGIQLEVGSVATAFSRAGDTLAGELAACQRYYFRYGGATSYDYMGSGIAASTTSGGITIKTPVTMRTGATSVEYSTLALYDSVNLTAVSSPSGVTIDYAAKDTIKISCAVASGLTQYRPYFLIGNASTSAYLGFSAEL